MGLRKVMANVEGQSPLHAQVKIIANVKGQPPLHPQVKIVTKSLEERLHQNQIEANVVIQAAKVVKAMLVK